MPMVIGPRWTAMLPIEARALVYLDVFINVSNLFLIVFAPLLPIDIDALIPIEFGTVIPVDFSS
jgi:hypothetical protein